jgi:hypothetical protein
MKAKFLALLLLAGGSLFAGPRVFFGFGYGPAYGGYYAPPPPPVYAYAPPAAVYPGPGSTWINGYWDYAATGYFWRPGYYARSPFYGAYWVGPRYFGGRYYRGYWGRRR